MKGQARGNFWLWLLMMCPGNLQAGCLGEGRDALSGNQTRKIFSRGEEHVLLSHDGLLSFFLGHGSRDMR